MGTQRRILHIEVGGSFGGSLRALESYIEHSRRSHKHSLLLYYPTPNTNHIRSLVDRYEVLKDHVAAPLAGCSGSGVVRRLAALALSSLKSVAEPVRAFPLTRQIAHVLQSQSYDLVHVNNTFPYQAASVIGASIAGVPVMSHIRNPIVWTALTRVLAHLSGCIVTVSNVFEADVRQYSSRPVFTCYDSVSLKPPDEAAASIRSAFATPDQVLIGSVGRLDTQKGYEFLIRAASLVCGRKPNVRFVIAGDGPLRQALQKLIIELGLGEAVMLCGFRHDISNFLSALDVFVSSSLWEGLPIAVVEAMLARKPVVATAVGGTGEAVRNGETGYLCLPADPASLAGALLSALSEDRHRNLQVETAARLARSVFDPVTTARRFDDIVEEFLDV